MKLWEISGCNEFHIHVLNVYTLTAQRLWACTAFQYLNKNSEVAMQMDGSVGLLLSVVTNWNSDFSTAQYPSNFAGTQNMGQEFELCLGK